MTDYERGYRQGYADAMNWKTQNHLEHLPGREWVGLTDEEMEGLYESATYMDETDCIHLLTLAADKLKEKNS